MKKMIRAVASRKMGSVFLYGVSSGLPLLLIGSTLKAWMKEQGVDLSLIGAFSLAGLPYSLKFLWAPLLDRYTPPWLGRRRGWILIFQVLLALLIGAMACLEPKQSPWLLGTLCLLVAFFSASQDIVIDAYRRDLLSDEELGLGSSFAVNGYRIGMLLAGALALWQADHMPWRLVYLSMSGIMVVLMGIHLFAPEPQTSGAPRNLREAVILPFVNFFQRSYAFEILLFIVLFKIGDSMASDMFNPLFLDLGYTKSEIAAIAKVFGLWATISGGFIGALAMVQIGIGRSLWVFGILQMFSTMGFSALAHGTHNLGMLTFFIAFENLCTGMATTAYVAFLASLCDRRYTATQFALLSSFMGVPRVIFGSTSGYFAKHLGWAPYYLFCTALHVPGLLLLLRQTRWSATREASQA
jgi:PAT family beta-lactamase induction signal transducer AmpG